MLENDNIWFITIYERTQKSIQIISTIILV